MNFHGSITNFPPTISSKNAQFSITKEPLTPTQFNERLLVGYILLIFFELDVGFVD